MESVCYTHLFQEYDQSVVFRLGRLRSGVNSTQVNFHLWTFTKRLNLNLFTSFVFCGFSGNWQMLMNVAQHWKSLRKRLLITVAFLFFRWNPHPPSSILKKGRGTSLLHIANQVQELCTVGTPSAVPPAWSATWDIFIPFLCFCLRFV